MGLDMSDVTYYPVATPATRPVTSRAYAAQTPRTASRPAFDYEETRGVSPTLKAACNQALRVASRELPGALAGVGLRFFAQYGGAPLRYVFSSANDIGGRIDPGRGLIWISGALGVEEGIRAVGHEVRHYWQIGRGMSTASREQDADAWAGAFWRRRGPGIEAWAHTYGRLAFAQRQ